MNISWGYKIALVYLGFVAMIITLVVSTYKTNWDLERKDYYEEELRYDHHYNALKNAGDFNKSVLADVDGQKLIITMPDELIANSTMEIWMYCPVNAQNDKKIKIDQLQAANTIDVSTMKKNTYEARITVFQNGKEFFFNRPVQLK